jgi:hypothetical protein
LINAIEPIFASYELRQAWVGFLNKFSFTHLLTLSFSAPQNFSAYATSDGVAIDRERIAHRYLARLSHRVFTRHLARNPETFLYHGFLERRARLGYPTYPHYHLLMSVPPEYHDRLYKYCETEWKKVWESEFVGRYSERSIDLKLIYNPSGIEEYATKLCHSCDMFISNLDVMQ